jgi:DNA-directed RNA polymerase specialized sigma24 family protein
MEKENKDVETIIENTMMKAFKSGRSLRELDQKEIRKATERRLFAYPDILARLEVDAYNTILYRSRDVVGFVRCGRIPQDQKDAVLEVEAIAAKMRDKTEVEAISSVLDAIKDDPYCETIEAKYFRQATDEEVATQLSCDERTVRRNRSRLLRRIAIRLYGVDAI